MKKFKSIISLFLALVMLSSTFLTVTACDSNKNKKDKKTKVEDEDEDDDEDGDDDDNKSKNGNLIKDPPKKYDELSLDKLEGVWVDERGSYCQFEDNYIYDAWGEKFLILSESDNGFEIEAQYEDYSELNSLSGNLALPSKFFLPMYLADDVLYIGNNELYRADSKVGKEYIEAIENDMSDKSFFASSDYDDLAYTFSSDHTIDLGFSEPCTWEISDGLLTLTIGDEPFSYFLRKSNDSGTYILGLPEYGITHFIPVDDSDFNCLEGEYYCLAKENLDDVYKTYELNIDLGVKEDFIFSFEPLSKDATSYEVSASNISGNDIDYIEGGIFDISYDGDEGVILKPESCDFGFVILNTLSYEYEAGGILVQFYSQDSIMGQLILYREDIVSGRIENIITSDFSMTYNDIQIDVNTDVSSDNLWHPDLYSAVLTYEDDYWYPYVLEDDSFPEYTPIVQVVPKEMEEYELVFTIPKDSSSYSENIEVVANTDTYLLDNYTVADYISVTKEETDDAVIFRCKSSYMAYYVLMDISGLEKYQYVMDAETLLTIDPTESKWALSGYNTDIFEMVDLDYIAESIFDYDTGSAIFWVSTPEELASATYYVNSLEVSEENYTATMFYIHLLNDIDLSGYDWAPLGVRYSTPNGDYFSPMFQGAFFGNGYMISNYTVNNPESYCSSSFFGNSHLATVIGLTLDNPIYNDANSIHYALIDGSCIMDVFDCHVYFTEGQLDDGYYFSEFDNDSIIYMDCTQIEIVDHAYVYETAVEDLDEGYYTEFYNGYDNWIKRYYQRDDGSYSYNAALEYEEYLKYGVFGFDNGSYYYGVGGPTKADEHIGYIDFSGWIYNGEFMVNYGNIREDY